MQEKTTLSELPLCHHSGQRHVSIWIFLRTFSVLCFTFTAQACFAQAQDSLLSLNNLKKMSLEDLMNIEVTSVSKHLEKLKATASAIQVITSEDIRRSGATSLPEALRLAPNLQVAKVNASQWAISSRGFDNVLANKLLVLIDGRTVYTPLYSGVFWDVQNVVLEDIDRIEVISGPGGTLWGANAVNGVINIITKSSKETKGLFAEVARGTKLPVLGSLRYGGKIADNLTFRVYGTGFQQGNTILKNDSSAKDEWSMGQGGFRFDWDANKNNQLTLQSNIYDGRPDPDGAKPVVAWGDNVLAKWNDKISEKSEFQLQAYYDYTSRDFGNGFAEYLGTYDLEGQYRHQFGQRNLVTFGSGARLMDHRVKNLPLFEFLPAHKLLQLYNVFIQDEITLIKERLRFTVGSKVENNSYTQFEYQPNARLMWTPSERQTIWTAASRAVRTPSRIDREFFLYAAPGIPFITGSNQVSETLLAYELGWRLEPWKKMSLSVSTFYNVYDDIRSAEPGPPPFGLPITFGNGVQGETYGAEFAATCQPAEWWRLRGGYTFLKKQLRIKPGSADLNKATAESNDPEHQYLIQSMMDLPGRIEFGTFLRFVDKLPNPNVPSYLGLDVQIGWKLTKELELSVTGQNLLNDHHAEFIPSSPSPRLIERNIYGKVTCRF